MNSYLFEESNSNMENETLTANYRPSILQRLLPAAVPVLLIAIGYVDPGKWAAAVDGGARFGLDLVVPMLVFNFAAIFCQYLSARITVVTGKDLAQICSEEYDMATCIFLGVQAEFSMIALDLSMILGIAHGLNLIFGVDLFTCVFLTLVDAVLFPLCATFLENGKAKFLCIGMASFVMLSYVFGVLISQPETPISMNEMPTKLSGESAFALMSLLGANIMPHNFYLHSSIVQQDLGPPNVFKRALCHDHFFAILCIFSGIFMVNYVLMNSAANVFHSTGLVLLTFQDALSLMDQVLRSPLVPFAFLLLLLFSNQIRALTWNLGRQAVLHDFFRIDIPGWLHHATIRIIAIVPALYCVWNSGAEGIYQLMIFIQVMVALVLPSSVIPLFRVASSRSIMGVDKISQFLEFLALISFIGMLGLNIIFVVEMIFGNSDWVGNLRWNLGSSISVPYVVLLITASVTLCLMIWLAATPLKSACSRLDAQVWNWDIQNPVPEPYAEKGEIDFIETKYHGDQSIQKQEPTLALGKSLDSHSDMSVTSADLNLPETLLDSDNVLHLTTIDESCSNTTFPGPPVCYPGGSATKKEEVSVFTGNEVSDGESLDTSNLKTESTDLVEKTVRVEGDLQTEKDDEGDTWEPEESSKRVSGSSPSLTSDGPGSFRSLSGKSDDGGSGAGSLSRLAGLGRAARRQLAAILDEFWGQLYDFHGQVTQEAKAKKLDVLLGVDSKVDSKPATTLKVDIGGKEPSGYYPSLGGRGSDSTISSNLYDTTKQQGLQRSIESSYGVQRGSSSMWSNHNHMQMLDAYVQNSSRNALDSGERRYSSLRLPPSSDGYDYQPATVHGYQIASYLNRIAKEKSSDYLNGQMESMTPKSPSLGTSNYKGSVAFALGQKPENGLSTSRPPGFPNLAVPRNSSLQSERPSYDRCSSRPVENVGSTVEAKKFYSLPDVSALLPHRNSHLPDKNARWDSTIGYRPSVGQTMYEQSPSTSSWARAASTFDELSPSEVCRDAFSLQFTSRSDARSMWTRQPYEQFGVADKIHATGGEGVGSRQTSINQETTSAVDLEAKLLQSFRYCIVKLLKLEGSDWLFRQNDGADEDLIGRVAARERFLYEAETREMNRGVHMGEFQYSSERKPGSTPKNDDTDITKFLVSSFPQCGEGCIWRVDLIISFGVWCIHRVLELSLMESRPELWGKYTYVLNRLQGIIDLAFSKPRCPMTPCFCLQIPVAYQQRSGPAISNGSLPPPVKQAKGKCTNAVMLLDTIKDVEMAISCRKGRTGTAAGDVAFPKGKENLVSVLKRYKRRLSNKPVAPLEGGSGSRKAPASASYGL